ncbi:type VII secretion protein EccCa [Yinghuangia seranimata]|uniref:type VII secretion protein EccCa n=1 Tax=Yinghuangia seranimata TaxID=408067 RepID=UPI00248B71A8|nr:type VII secretion protein EccCa [Yinghuangia seranimata]MDI2132481.1 type VII secretion protein EccCa [Yinghuangia seranimata]
MTVVIVKRPPRVHPPGVPSDALSLESPPELERKQEQSWMASLLPMMTTLGSAGFLFMPGANKMMFVMGGMMMVSSMAMVVANIVRARKGNSPELLDARRDYLKYLDQQRIKVRRTAKRQRSAQLWTHPAPDQLWSVVAGGRRLWERRATDGDFGQIRLGTGQQRLSTPLVAPATAPLEDLEPLCADSLRRFMLTQSMLDDLPMAVSLRSFYHLTVSGDPDTVYGVTRAMLGQLTVLHSPDDIVVAAAIHPSHADRWDWIKWLPHLQHTSESDGAGPVRMVATDLGEIERLLGDHLTNRPRFAQGGAPVLDQPHVVVVLDGGTIPAGSVLAGAEGLQGVTIIEVVAGPLDELRGGLAVIAEPDRLILEAASGTSYSGQPDLLSVADTESLARALAPLRLSGNDGDEPLLANLDFTDLMGVGDAASVDMSRTWRPRPPHDKLRVPIGLGENGEPILLDLKEAALEGMGPHGLCVGATGSGKSELLRTLVLGLAMTHSSEILNFVLADFKGGATFLGMSDMPHVAAVITNLSDDLTLVDRMRDSITGELNRRQELLRAAGNYANIHDYERARTAGAALEPLPSLVIIIDEFSELLTAKPDFIDMFIQIGRIGRSLGVHLLLASQRLEEGRLRGLDTYLSYRIGLRTFSAAESRAAIGVPDAYTLPSVPGSGLLKFGTESMARFKAAYVSGPYRPSGQSHQQQEGAPRPVAFSNAWTPEAAFIPAQNNGALAEPEPEPVAQEQFNAALADTVLDVIVKRMAGQGPPAHQVWLPPLSESPSMDTLFASQNVPLTPTPERGLSPVGWGGNGRLAAPLGVVDKPFEQRRDLLHVDLSGAAGHVLIVGGTRSGKTTLTRSLITSLALTHTPGEVQFYCLDFGGGGLQTVNELPHVGGVAGRLDAEMVRRIVSEVSGIVDRREELFRSHNIDSITTFRSRRAQGLLPDEPWGDVFLVIDGWLTVKNDYEALESVITEIATRGLGYGVHVVITAGRWPELRPALKDQIQTRLELRLGEPMESEVDRRIAVNVPTGAPGRGLTPEGLHFLAALPRIDGSSDPEDLADGSADLVAHVKAAWQGSPAPRVRMLPRMLPYEQLPGPDVMPGLAVPIGIDETQLATVSLDFNADPSFVLFGETESGKSNFLRMVARGICERYTPEQARIIVADYRRSLLGAVPESHLLVYAAAAPALQPVVPQVAGSLSRRLPGPEVTQEQLRNRSWWSDPEIFFIIDDYDLVATSGGNPLAPLLEYLPLARDVGLHLIIARSSGGASRSLYEPVLQKLNDLGTPGMLLSGNRDEGALIGNMRPQQLPPGRAQFYSRRRGIQMIQTAWVPFD